MFFLLVSPVLGGLCGFSGCFNERIGKQAQTLPGRIGYVDTRVGTGGVLWMMASNSPAVSTPLGMVKLGPDTTGTGAFLSTSGYHYADTTLAGFSHTRFMGSGVWEGGAVRVVPANAELSAAELNRYRPSFSHSTEIAVPGHYGVTLSGNIQVELAASSRVGWHRYRFADTDHPHVYVNLVSHLARKGSVLNADVQYDSGLNRFIGSFTLKDDFSNRYGGLPTYFAIQPDSPIQSYRVLRDAPPGVWLDLAFAKAKNDPVVVKVGLSFTSVAGAAFNLDSETAGKTFDGIVAATQAAWEAQLGRASVGTGDEKKKKIYYTALYRAFQMPTLFSDYPNGGTRKYTGFDRQEHQSASDYYSDLTLWDSFRTVHPLYNLIARDFQLDIIRSMLLMADQSGRLPRWAAGGGHADSMLGFPATLVIAESFLKGITGFDSDKAYGYMALSATKGSGLGGRECFDFYANYGYCPSDLSNDSVSYTLEYARADHALGLLAAKLGKTSDSDAYLARARNYGNLWDRARSAFVPKDSAGKFLAHFSLTDLSYLGVTETSRHYREGCANHYRWYVAQDPEGLRALFGGSLAGELQAFFAKAPVAMGSPIPPVNYWHGNEHDIHAVALFNHDGRPDLTQYWTRWIQSTKYDYNSIGLDGNDDGGTLSSWFVLTALGLFPVAGTQRYEITSPLFDSATLDLGGGNQLRLSAPGAGQGKGYVRGARLNGTALANPWFDHDAIASGGDLVFDMADDPQSWTGR